MKLSIAATVLASVFSAARGADTALCGADHKIELAADIKTLKFDGFKIVSYERIETDEAPKIILKDFGAVPLSTMDISDTMTIVAGAPCAVKDPESGAMTALSACSLMMGYPMLAGATMLASNFLPVFAGDEDCAGYDISVEVHMPKTKKPRAGTNVCDGAKVTDGFANFPCADIVVDEIEMKDTPQAGANITKGYVGGLTTASTPLTVPYYKTDLCPVNVHWHLGAEHLSVGEYDEDGKGPTSVRERRKLAGEVRLGGQCHYYDSEDPKFTTPYEWQHCDSHMEVGQTYEVHWPHSAFGACGTPNQYQYPFYDGVFCHIGTRFDASRELAHQIGVQGQVFTIVNDESYYYPDMISGMIIDGEMGQDIAAYTGSTTGTTRSNTVCSAYSPITWQVDRKCHMISASSFDKMCADMKSMRDDMTDDLAAHGSREVVDTEYVADNQAAYQAPP